MPGQATPDALVILHGARKLIADPRRWYQGPLSEGARDASGRSVSPGSNLAVRWTLFGACEAVVGSRVAPIEFLILKAALSCGYDAELMARDHSADSRMVHARDIKILDTAIQMTLDSERRTEC
jgi:hypothetical protein